MKKVRVNINITKSGKNKVGYLLPNGAVKIGIFGLTTLQPNEFTINKQWND